MLDNKQILEETQQADDKPDDQGNILIDGFVRIHDPNTNEILLEVRE